MAPASALPRPLLVLASLSFAAAASTQSPSAAQTKAAPVPIPATYMEARKMSLDAANRGTLHLLTRGWVQTHSRTGSPVLAYGLWDAGQYQQDLALKGLAASPEWWVARKVYDWLGDAAGKTRAAYPIVAQYYLLAEHGRFILPNPPATVDGGPYTVRDPKTGRIVAQGRVQRIVDDPRIPRKLDALYAEMVRRDAEDPMVRYLTAMRAKEPALRVQRLTALAGAADAKPLYASILLSLSRAQREAGHQAAARQTEGELRAYIASKSNVASARLFRLQHPELFGR